MFVQGHMRRSRRFFRIGPKNTMGSKIDMNCLLNSGMDAMYHIFLKQATIKGFYKQKLLILIGNIQDM